MRAAIYYGQKDVRMSGSILMRLAQNACRYLLTQI